MNNFKKGLLSFFYAALAVGFIGLLIYTFFYLLFNHPIVLGATIIFIVIVWVARGIYNEWD